MMEGIDEALIDAIATALDAFCCPKCKSKEVSPFDDHSDEWVCSDCGWAFFDETEI